MSWSKQTSIKPEGAGKIRVKIKDHAELAATELSTVGDVVEKSREILPFVLAQLAWPRGGSKPDRDARLNRYFKTGATPSQGDISTIYAKLELTMNGINGKVNVKVAPNPRAYGYVGLRGGAKGLLRGLFSPRHNFGRDEGRLITWGDIHLDTDVLDDFDLAVVTFIHEATHKFASTNDYGDAGYLKNDGLRFRKDGLQNAQALNNADSYAWFCMAEYTGLL